MILWLLAKASLIKEQFLSKRNQLNKNINQSALKEMLCFIVSINKEHLNLDKQIDKSNSEILLDAKHQDMKILKTYCRINILILLINLNSFNKREELISELIQLLNLLMISSK